MRYINADLVLAVHCTTPAENPLLTDDSRLMDVWFAGAVVRKQMFKKVRKAEQEGLCARLEERGFIRSRSLLFDPRAVLFAEMESELLGGVIVIGCGDNGKPVELKIDAASMELLGAR